MKVPTVAQVNVEVRNKIMHGARVSGGQYGRAPRIRREACRDQRVIDALTQYLIIHFTF